MANGRKTSKVKVKQSNKDIANISKWEMFSFDKPLDYLLKKCFFFVWQMQRRSTDSKVNFHFVKFLDHIYNYRI